MTPFRLFGLLSAALLLSAIPARAQTSYPMVTHALPGAVQTGTTREVTVHGKMNFAGASLVHFEGTGVTAEIVPPEPAKGKKTPAKPTSVKIKVTVAADAILGPRELRIATAQGISSVGQLVITDYPVVVEKGKHGVIADAQAIEIGRMVTGTIAKNEEVDVYRFSVTEGQRVTFAIRSARLMHKVHDLQKHFDPLLSVHDDADRELTSNDDYYFADPMVSYLFPKAGEYFVKVRDVRFAGDGRWSYSLLVTDRPYVTALFPMALNPSDPRRVQAVGHGLESSEFVLPVPATDATPGTRTVQLATPAGPTNPVVVTVTDRPTRVENEANDEPAGAELLTLPVVVNGRIERASDIDHFAFDLHKGSAVRFEIHARRRGSNLDSRLRLLDPKGKAVANGDDHKTTKDSVLTYTPPADGRYTLEVRDLLYRGGATFGYILDSRPDEPDFELVSDDDKAGIAPGLAAPWFIKATRIGGFAGPIEIRVEGLPAGVSVNPLTIGPTMTQGVLVLRADPKAQVAAAPVRVIGRAEVELPDGTKHTIERTVQPMSEIYLPGGGRGNMAVGTQMVGVCGELDLTAIDIQPKCVSLKPGEQVTLEVSVKRSKGYKGRVTLDPRLRHLGRVYADPLPPGVTVVEQGSKTSLAPNEDKGKIILKAAADAKSIQNVPITVMANVSINFVVKRAYASPAILVSVTDPAADSTAEK